MKIILQLDHVLRKRVGAVRAAAAQGPRRDRVRAGRPAEAKVDPAGKQRGQRAELLGDHQRRVIRQHDSTRADPDRGRTRRHVPDHHGRGRAGDAGHVVMLRHPVPAIAQLLGMARQVERAVQRVGGCAALVDRREIEDGKRNHRTNCTGAADLPAADCRILKREDAKERGSIGRKAIYASRVRPLLRPFLAWRPCVYPSRLRSPSHSGEPRARSRQICGRFS